MIRDRVSYELTDFKTYESQQAWKWLVKERKLDPRVVCFASVGVVPDRWDIALIIDAAQSALERQEKAVDAVDDLDKHDALKEVLKRDKKDFEHFKQMFESLSKKAGWIVTVNENEHGDPVSAMFRQIAKDPEGKKVTRLLKPMTGRGVFFPVANASLFAHEGRWLATEGEFNQLRLLSELARHADRLGEPWEEWMVASMTSGVGRRAGH